MPFSSILGRPVRGFRKTWSVTKKNFTFDHFIKSLISNAFKKWEWEQSISGIRVCMRHFLESYWLLVGFFHVRPMISNYRMKNPTGDWALRLPLRRERRPLPYSGKQLLHLCKRNLAGRWRRWQQYRTYGSKTAGRIHTYTLGESPSIFLPPYPSAI